MNKKGFTLIEVIAVISILSLVFVVAIPKVNDYIKSRKNDTFITNARNILRQLEYENLEYKTFEKTTLEDLNIKGISKDDFDLSSSVAYVIENEIYIDLVGKGKYKDMYICKATGNKKDISIQNEPCDIRVYVDFAVD